MSSPDPVVAQLAAYNARDLAAFVPCFSTEVRIEDGFGNVRFANRDEMAAFYGPMFEANPELHCELRSRVRVGDWVFDEERITGRGPVPLHVMAAYRVEGGVIVHLRLFREDDRG